MVRPAFSCLIGRSTADTGRKRMTRAPARVLRMVRRIAFLAMCTLALSKLACADSIPAPRTEPVMDLADFLSPAAEQMLAQQLKTLRQRSGVDLVVVTLPSLQYWSIERWGHELRTAWAVGERSSLGAVLIVAGDERQAHIEVGEGLSPMLPDAAAAKIVKTRIDPLLQSGDFAGGTLAGIDAIIKKVMAPVSAVKTVESASAQPANEPAATSPADVQRPEWTQYTTLALYLAILVLAIWIIAKLRNWLGGNAMQLRSPMPNGTVARFQGVVQGANERAAPWFFGRRARQVGGGNASVFTRSRHAAGGGITQAMRSGSGGRGMSRAIGDPAAAGEGNDRPRASGSGR